jgi:hypothetical protein
MQTGRHLPCAHRSGAAQVPQSRALLQPSLASPHSTPRSAQVWGAHRETSTPAHTPPWQGMQGSHVPQSIVPPHPSSQVSQLRPAVAHVRGTQGEQSPAWPPAGQVPSELHVPHSRESPQPSSALPHEIPASAQLFGRHIAMPQQSQSHQASGGMVTAPQQFSGRPLNTQAQLPHWIRLPQPSDAGPPITPRSAHVWGWQGDAAHALHCPGMPAAPHAWSDGHDPQSRTPPQPSSMAPQAAPCAAQVVAVGQGPPLLLDVELAPEPPPPAAAPLDVVLLDVALLDVALLSPSTRFPQAPARIATARAARHRSVVLMGGGVRRPRRSFEKIVWRLSPSQVDGGQNQTELLIATPCC